MPITVDGTSINFKSMLDTDSMVSTITDKYDKYLRAANGLDIPYEAYIYIETDIDSCARSDSERSWDSLNQGCEYQRDAGIFWYEYYFTVS